MARGTPGKGGDGGGEGDFGRVVTVGVGGGDGVLEGLRRCEAERVDLVGGMVRWK